MIPILILAAGASTRMRGRDKLLEQIDGVSLLRRQTLRALQASDDVRVALPPRPHGRCDALTGLDVRRVPVADAAQGLSASLRALIATLGPDVGRAMILLADLPDLTGDDLKQVAGGPALAPDALVWRGATAQGQAGHPIVIDASLFPAFGALTGDAGGHAILRDIPDRVHLVALDGDRARRDLDTPEAWAAWRAAR